VRVEVLLATHNGQKYISQFLDSLVDQRAVEIDLIVSDDGSSDETLRIVNSYINSFRSLKVLNGPNMGAKNNFAFLIQNSDSDYSAFADQDDIWFPDHLLESTSRLAPHIGRPALAFSKVLEFSESGPSRVWPKISRSPDLPILLTENLARGCTIVLNRNLVNLLKRTNFSEIYMHDWWAILAAKTCGIVEFINTPAVKYRIHEENVIGATKSIGYRLRLFCRSYFLEQEWLPQSQASLLMSQLGGFVNIQDQSLIQSFSNLNRCTIKVRYKFLYQKNLVLRQSRFENGLLKLVLLLSPRIRSK
jgi:glycosyltransferase involved in cell wall biosynthesis